MKTRIVTAALALLLTRYPLPLTPHSLSLLDPETLRPVGGLPAHVTGRFEEPVGLQQAPSGDYYIFDRRSQAVFAYTPGAEAPRKIIQIGTESGRVLQPTAFDFATDNTFVLADAPGGEERLQIFTAAGSSLGGFLLGRRAGPRLVIGGTVLNGVGSLEYTGSAIFISQPESGALVSEYGVDGRARRSFGELRRTGHEADPELHVALNVGLPIADRDGGFYFVFLAGVPMFRKYDAAGTLLFERHVEGTEVDRLLGSLPTTWRARRASQGEAAVVPPSVRTAALDRAGNLWISLAVPYTYVYDRAGDKRRIVQFRAAGVLSPSSLFFAGTRVLITPGCYAFPAA